MGLLPAEAFMVTSMLQPALVVEARVSILSAEEQAVQHSAEREPLPAARPEWAHTTSPAALCQALAQSGR